MSGKPIILLPLAERDIGEAVEHYRREGGAALATRWTDAVTTALRHVGTHPASGSPRYVDVLGVPGLRFWRVKGFPHLVFHVERAAQVDIWRVLHGRRDMATWLHDKD